MNAMIQKDLKSDSVAGGDHVENQFPSEFSFPNETNAFSNQYVMLLPLQHHLQQLCNVLKGIK